MKGKFHFAPFMNVSFFSSCTQNYFFFQFGPVTLETFPMFHHQATAVKKQTAIAMSVLARCWRVVMPDSYSIGAQPKIQIIYTSHT